jgi:hypothetical protein
MDDSVARSVWKCVSLRLQKSRLGLLICEFVLASGNSVLPDAAMILPLLAFRALQKGRHLRVARQDHHDHHYRRGRRRIRYRRHQRRQ